MSSFSIAALHTRHFYARMAGGLGGCVVGWIFFILTMCPFGIVSCCGVWNLCGVVCCMLQHFIARACNIQIYDLVSGCAGAFLQLLSPVSTPVVYVPAMPYLQTFNMPVNTSVCHSLSLPSYTLPTYTSSSF